MRVAKAIWGLVVGIKDILVLIFMLLFFTALYALLSARPTPTVSDGVLVLNLRSGVVEQPAEQDAFALAGGGAATPPLALRDVREALRKAKDDNRVKAIALDLDGFSAGQTVVADLGESLDEARRSGKPVLAYATAYADRGYQLAAHASEIWVNPMGGVQLSGPGGNNLYFAGLLEKLGVTANVYKVGSYKSAVEPFTRSDMSPEARENAQALSGSLFEIWRDDIRKARPKANVDLALRQPVQLVRAAGGDFAVASQRAGLVDKVADRRAFETRLAELGGADEKVAGGYKRIRFDRYIAAEVRGERGSGPIGVVTVAGNIVDGRASLGTAGGDSIAEAIEKGLRDDKIKALVVRIDSPGGSALASERIRQALLAAREKNIPVVASMGNVAASGGYWVAAAAQHIIAEPSTITGSIGVFGILPSFQGSLAKLGINADGVRTTPLSGEPDLLKGPSPEAGQLIQLGVESTYGKFLNIVGQARGKTPQQVDAVGQGRVWSGGQARQLGLVDQFGGMDEAVAKAGELARLNPDNRGLTYLERKASWRAELAGLLRGDDEDVGASSDPFAALRSSPDALAAAVLREAELLLNGPTIQARCLDCGATEVRTAPSAPPAGWLGRLLALLS